MINFRSIYNLDPNLDGQKHFIFTKDTVVNKLNVLFSFIIIVYTIDTRPYNLCTLFPNEKLTNKYMTTSKNVFFNMSIELVHGRPLLQ